MKKLDTERVVAILNRLLEAELAGVVAYTHYSFMVFGFGRIPIVSWLRAQADESLVHAQQVGEWITTLGAYPSLEIGPLLDSHKTDIARDAARVARHRNGMRSRSTASCSTPCRRRLGRARGVRAADDPRRRAARRGSRQDAAQARRRRGVRSAGGLTPPAMDALQRQRRQAQLPDEALARRAHVPDRVRRRRARARPGRLRDRVQAARRQALSPAAQPSRPSATTSRSPRR